MKQLDKVLTNTTWAKASNTINLNNDALYVAVTALEHAAFKHKGYFKTVALLQEAYPTAEEGSQAFVYNSANPTTAPYDIYTWTNTGWQDSGVNGGNVDVNLDDKQDTLVGYSETVSNGKATQIAIEGDTIALGGKVSIGQINNLETAILLSSAQASNAETIANTIKNEVSLLKQPVKPLLLNANGKLELSVGQGLYVSDGKLCANMAAGGSGSGGGMVYSEGDGIALSGSKISVKHGDGLKIQDTYLTIATGDGLCFKSGGILAINPSDGLGFTTSGMLKLNLHEKSGLKVDSEGLGVNVGVALGTVDGKLNVQYGSGLGKGSDNKLEVLVGTGLAVDGGTIKIADAEYTKIEAVGEKQDKLLGYSESKNGDNTLNVNVTASRVGIKGTTDITITSPSLNLNNVSRINGAVFSGLQTSGDINLNAKSIISSSVDPGELKVLHRGSPYGFIARTVDNPSDPQGLMLIELLSTDGYDSYKYSFPPQSGEVALKTGLDALRNLISNKQNLLNYYREDSTNGTVEVFAQSQASISVDYHENVSMVETYYEEDENGAIPIAHMFSQYADGDYASFKTRGSDAMIQGDSVSLESWGAINLSAGNSSINVSESGILIVGASLDMKSVTKILNARFGGFQTDGDINIKGKTRIAQNIDAGELKVLRGTSSYGFILRTVDNPSNQNGLKLVELLSTDGYSSYKYSFPSKSGEVALKSDLKTYTAGDGIDINGSSINVETPILNLSTRVYEMGNYSASSGAESAAAGASIAGNNGIVIMRYTVDDTKQEGVILQQVGGNSTVQYLLWGGAMYIRTITFSDTNKTTVTQVREWWKLGAARTKYDSSTRKIHLADAWGNNINGNSNAVLPIASTSVCGLMSTSQVETLNSLATSKQDKLTIGSGLSDINGTLSISIGTGLSYDATSGVPCIALAPQSYLKFYDEGNGMTSLAVDIEAIRAALNNGASPIDGN